MASIPFWHETTDPIGYDGPVYPSNPWDLCKLADRPLPGIAVVKAIAGMKIDVQKAAGRDGAMLIEQGYVPGQVDIELTMWRPEQLEAWNELLPLLWRKAQKPGRSDIQKAKTASEAAADQTERAALKIDHPATTSLNISAVLISQIGSPEETQPGFRVVKIKALEFSAAAKKKRSQTKRTEASKARLDARIASDAERAKATPPRPSATDRGPKGPPAPTSQGAT